MKDKLMELAKSAGNALKRAWKAATSPESADEVMVGVFVLLVLVFALGLLIGGAIW